MTGARTGDQLSNRSLVGIAARYVRATAVTGARTGDQLSNRSLVGIAARYVRATAVAGGSPSTAYSCGRFDVGFTSSNRAEGTDSCVLFVV